MTANKAASETRLRIIRKIKRLCQSDDFPGYNVKVFADELIAFIQAMDERANKRKGGLGKRSTSRRKAMGVI